MSVTGDKDDPATLITPATAIDADGQSVPVATRVEGDTVVYDVDHAEGKVAYPATLDPLFYSQTFTAGQQADGWFGQNTPNTTLPFTYIYPTGPQRASQLSIYAPPGSYPLGATAAWGRFAPGNPAVGTPQNGPGSRLISGEHGYWTRFVAGNVVYAVVPTQAYHYYNYPIGTVGFGNASGATTTSTTLTSGTNGATVDISAATHPTDGTIGFGLTDPANALSEPVKSGETCWCGFY